MLSALQLGEFLFLQPESLIKAPDHDQARPVHGPGRRSARCAHTQRAPLRGVVQGKLERRSVSNRQGAKARKRCKHRATATSPTARCSPPSRRMRRSRTQPSPPLRPARPPHGWFAGRRSPYEVLQPATYMSADVRRQVACPNEHHRTGTRLIRKDRRARSRSDCWCRSGRSRRRSGWRQWRSGTRCYAPADCCGCRRDR